MNSPAESSLRTRLIPHTIVWELRRLCWPLLLWVMAATLAAVYVHAVDWKWPPPNRLDLWQAHQSQVFTVSAGMSLCVVGAVYFIGELFIPLRPGAVRGRFAWPVRRGDTLLVSMLIVAVLVVVPLVFYYRGWVMSRNWYDDNAQFCRQFLPVVPVCAAGLVLAALTAGDWGVYLLTAALTLLAVFWTEGSRGPEPLSMGPALFLTALAIAAAFAGQRWLLRWPLYGAWLLFLLLAVRRW